MRYGVQGCQGGSIFLPIFYLIFESFEGVGFTALIFWYISHLIFDALCLQNKLRVDQKWLNNETCTPLLSIMQFINNLVGEDVVSVSQTMESCTTDITPVVEIPNNPFFNGRHLIVVDTPGFNSVANGLAHELQAVHWGNLAMFDVHLGTH